MKTVFTVHADMSPVSDSLRELGLDKGGAAQEFLISELKRMSAPYTPFKEGMLTASARISKDKEAVEYHNPYAQFHWFGKLMVSPSTGSAWAKKDEKKVLTNRDLQYRNEPPMRGPLRGPRWVERCVIDNSEKLTSAVLEHIARYKK